MDILQVEGNKVRAIEIKSGKTVSQDYFKGIRALKKTSLDLLEPSLVVYDGDQPQERSEARVLPFISFASDMT